MSGDAAYDEGTALRCYYASNRQFFMTDNEKQALRLSWIRLAAETDQECADELTRVLANTPQQVHRESLKSPDEIYDEIDRRLMHDYSKGRMAINRCPECRRIVRTPLARQCLWCGHDWRGT